MLTRPEGSTVREMLSTTGWTHSALKAHITKVVRGQLGYTISVQRNPSPDPADAKLTSYLYFGGK
jgi:hypothetical protein